MFVASDGISPSVHVSECMMSPDFMNLMSVHAQGASADVEIIPQQTLRELTHHSKRLDVQEKY